MKSTIFASALALATSASAAAIANPTFSLPQFCPCLPDSQASTIVAKFVSILEGVEYQGQSPNVTASQVVAPNYVEYSDSILSLEKAPVRTLIEVLVTFVDCLFSSVIRLPPPLNNSG